MNPTTLSKTRRSFLQSISLGTAALGIGSAAFAKDKTIQGFEEAPFDPNASKAWKPVSDRRIRVGIVGYGYCRFGAAFSFQDHPNVEIAAVSDLLPDRRAGLAKACRCKMTYPSLEELVKDDSIEAVFVATDAPSHARHCIEVLKHGKHVACAVPAVWGSLEEADQLLETVKNTGRKYMMFETSYYRPELYAMHRIYNAGGFGKLIYSEGEYYHYAAKPLPSYKGWRVGNPPQWYPTHSNAYYNGVTGGRFTEVSCMGMPSVTDFLQPENNPYRNPFGTEVAMFRTSEGGMSRMTVSWDTPGDHGERGRVRGQRGSFYNQYEGQEKNLPDIRRPALPPGVRPGGHGGSHGQLTNEFVHAILEDRQPWIDIVQSLNMTVSGIVAHLSAMKNGEWMKIPQYKLS
jgi:predicted dehydrogenase